jgi:hypothetical protein
MIRPTAVLLLSLLALPLPAQDDVHLRDLLQKLDDDSIDVRSAAADALAKMNPSVLPLLRRSVVGAGPEIRDRLAEIIRKIEERERLASLLPAPSRITIDAKNRPLRDVFLDIAKQSKTPLEIGDVAPDARVTVSLRDVPLWKALEAVCKASGKAMVGVDGDHILISGEPYVELPGRMTDHFRVTLESIELKSNGSFGQPDRFETFNANFRVSWEKGARPWRIVGKLLELVDESGTDLVGGAEGDSEFTTSIASDMIQQDFLLDWPHGPGPQAQRIARLKAGIEFQFPLRYAEVKLDVSNGKVPAAAECPEYSVKLTHLERQDGVLIGNLTFVPGAMPPEGDLGADSVVMRDKSGKEYRGNVNDAPSVNENETAHLISFPDAPVQVVAAEILIRIPSQIHREKLDVELKDVPLK